MLLTHPTLPLHGSGEQRAFEYYAQTLRQLADELEATHGERAQACRVGADVLESLAEPMVSWPDT